MKKIKFKTIFILFVVVLVFILSINLYAKQINYREEMRKFVILISQRAKSYNKKFAVVPQNALELVVNKKRIAKKYLAALDGVGCEELYYGMHDDGDKTPGNTTRYFLKYLNMVKRNKKQVLVIDYIKNQKQALASFNFSKKNKFISTQAERTLSKIPKYQYNHHPRSVNNLNEAQNFLYILTVPFYYNKPKFKKVISESNYDILVIDAFFHEKMLTKNDLEILKTKKSGQKRIVLAYMSIGEAETYRYYWGHNWKSHPPSFLEEENPEWDENYKVKYWQEDWKKIICGQTDGTGFESSYLKKILEAGFDGVYLDIVDAAFYFERKIRAK